MCDNRHQASLDLQGLLLVTKAVILVGTANSAKRLINRLTDVVCSAATHIDPCDLSYLVEIPSLIGASAGENSILVLRSRELLSLDRQFVSYIFQLITAHSKEFDGSELSRIYRFACHIGFKDSNTFSALAATALGKCDSITACEMSWILWGMARLKYLPSRRDFDKMAQRIASELEVSIKYS